LEQIELIRRARQGDEAAWEVLMRQNQDTVFRLAYLRLGDPDVAEDVAQETFIRALRALPRFDTTRPLRPWLLQIALNLVRNRQRSIGRYLAALRRWAQDNPFAEQEIEDDTVQRQDAQLLWQAVKRLPQRDQDVIYLRYFLELPIDQAAEALDVPTGTVKSRLHRALKRLAAVIDNDFPALREGRIP
jgi:RNA polymerase sigma-70 factor (ECF subfamily)